jgi:hypothetical protein
LSQLLLPSAKSESVNEAAAILERHQAIQKTAAYRAGEGFSMKTVVLRPYLGMEVIRGTKKFQRQSPKGDDFGSHDAAIDLSSGR